MSVTFYLGEESEDGRSVRWIEGFEHLDLNVSNDNADWMLGLIDVDLAPYYSGTLTTQQVRGIIRELKLANGVVEPSVENQAPLVINCGRTQAQVDRYTEFLEYMVAAALEIDGAKIVYA